MPKGDRANGREVTGLSLLIFLKKPSPEPAATKRLHIHQSGEPVGRRSASLALIGG